MTAKDLFEFIKKHWRDPLAIPVIVIAVLGLELGLFKLLAEGLPEWELWTGAGSALGIVALWLWLNRCPKHRADRIGFSIAIDCDDEAQRNRLLADLAGKLKHLLLSEPAPQRFDLIIHDQSRATLIRDHEAASRLMNKARAHILIFGSAKLREIDGKQTHVLRFEGCVRHALTPEAIAREFGKEFRTVLPPEYMIEQKNDFFAFEAAAVQFHSVAKYIIGTAALISGDYALAQEEFESLLESSPVKEGKFEPSSVRLQMRLADVHRNRATILAELYRLKRDKALLPHLEHEIIQLERYDKSWYSGPLNRAICAFILRRDLELCWQMVERCKTMRPDDCVWRYTEAVLHAYTGNLGKALKIYDQVFQSPLEDQTVPIQCEEFINAVINDEPDKPQLYYCTGLINWKSKGDKEGAKRDFDLFISNVSANKFTRERNQIEKWLSAGLPDDSVRPTRRRAFKF